MKSLMITLVLFTGCQTIQEISPAVHLANAQSIYTVTVSTMVELARAGVINLETAEEFEKIRIRAAELLEAEPVNFVDLNATIKSLQTILDIVVKQ